MINHRFEIKSKIGEGRSSVFLCHDTFTPGKEFAIKILPPNVSGEEEKQFRQEFFTLQKLDHPNIINPFDYGTIVNIDEETERFGIRKNSKFITTEYFEGVELLSLQNKIDADELEKLTREILSVLYYLHQANYIYNDLKPENILVKKSDGNFEIRFIDFGLIIDRAGDFEIPVSGTSEYIAPERLEKKPYDHRIDLYSLGILIYFFIYGKFPFDTKNEMEIYRSHINQEFTFPEIGKEYNLLIELAKKLLVKDPEDRFFSSLEVFQAQGFEIPLEIKKEWKPGNRFIADKELEESFYDYFQSDSSQVVLIKGDSGSGKTTLLQDLYQRIRSSIYIPYNIVRTGVDFWKFFINKIVYLEDIYPKTNQALVKYLEQDDGESETLVDDAKAIINKISQNVQFTLLLDDFNFYDDLTIELLQQLVPILQVNKIKIVITENTNRSIKTDFIHNKNEFFLNAFSEEQVGALVEKNLAGFFPRNELRDLIINYSDRLPGSIHSFYKDLNIQEILKYNSKLPYFDNDKVKPELLKKSHDEIYKLRLSKLEPEELRTAEILSAINFEVDKKIFSQFDQKQADNYLYAISSLKKFNIATDIENGVKFTSTQLKNYIYYQIPDKQNLHKNIAEFLKKVPGIDNREIAFHLRKAGKYKESYEFLRREIELSERLSTYKYKKSLLEEARTLPLSDDKLEKIFYEYADVLFKLGEYKKCLEFVEEEKEIEDEKSSLELNRLKGKSLIKSGEYNKGKNILEKIIDDFDGRNDKNEILIDIADAELDLNNFDRVEEIVDDLNKKKLSSKEKSRILNLQGLIKIYKDSDFQGAIEIYKQAQRIHTDKKEIAKKVILEINLGNLYSILEEFENALQIWETALRTNASIGNLENEGMILSNKGVLCYYAEDLEEAVNSYNRAYDIYYSIGNNNRAATILINNIEVLTELCEYEKVKEILDLFNLHFNDIIEHEDNITLLILKCKFYLYINDNNSIKDVIKEYYNLIDDETISKQTEINFSLLKGIELFLDKKYRVAEKYLNEYSVSITESENQDDLVNYCKVHFLIARINIIEKNYEVALQLLQNTKLIEINSLRDLITAERLYYLALIARKRSDLVEESEYDLLSKAMKLIEDKSITELHYKVFFALAEYFESRGNINKMEYHLFYAKSLLNFIADNMKDEKMKELYLSEQLRSSILKK